MMHVILVFVIVLAAVMMTGGSLGKKVTDGARDFNIPMPGAYCPGDAGVVDKYTFMKNIQLAAKVAWNGQKACWLKQELDTGTVTWEDMVNNITYATEGVIGNNVDDCYQSAWSASPINTLDEVDMVLWWDDQPVCNTGGIFTGTISWLWETSGSSRDTLFFYPRMEYCKGGSLINWYNPPRNSNIYKYSQSKGRLNDNNICRDERDSSGVGTDYSLPNIVDLNLETDDDARDKMKTEMRDCIKSYQMDFAGGWNEEYDNSEDYFACEETYLFKPKDRNYDINEIIELNFFQSVNYMIPQYDEDGNFDYRWDVCDMLDSSGSYANEFNSVTWNRDSKEDACIYYFVNRFIKTEKDLIDAPDDDDKFLKDNTYKITAFYYFEKDDVWTKDGRNDIIIVIDKQQ